MPDATATGLMYVWDWVKQLWVLLLGLLMWNGKRMVNKIDDLEKSKIDKDTFNATLQSLRVDIKGIGKEVKTDISALHSRIDKLVDK